MLGVLLVLYHCRPGAGMPRGTGTKAGSITHIDRDVGRLRGNDRRHDDGQRRAVRDHAGGIAGDQGNRGVVEGSVLNIVERQGGARRAVNIHVVGLPLEGRLRIGKDDDGAEGGIVALNDGLIKGSTELRAHIADNQESRQLLVTEL